LRPMPTPLPIDRIRSQFPALNRNDDGIQAAYLDGPGGTQVPQAVIDAMAGVLRAGVSNVGGGFGASDLAEEVVSAGRTAMADFFNCDPDEVVFGQNMTSLTFAFSRALARTWNEGDAIVLTSLDHDANFTPWVRAAEDAGVEVRITEFDPETGVLDASSIADLLDEKVRLVAVCLAANSTGTLVDVAAVSAAAHEVGAVVYIDAVHAGPHHLIDVKALDCDFLVASAYKFFGPHTGILFGRFDLLASLNAYKVRPAPSDPPGKWETGTQSFESIAGVAAAVDYIASLGVPGGTRRQSLESAFSRIFDHEIVLSQRFLDGLAALDRVRLYGVPAAGTGRVATFAIGVEGVRADAVAAALAGRGLYVWSGNYYAVNVMDRLGVSEGGLVRIGFVHYNTAEEVDRVLEGLSRL
ncbi:MAG: cysteine desulfurase-like protein, partial [Acidimicrobiia bacterium]